MEGDVGVESAEANDASVRVRDAGGRLPCNEYKVAERGSMLGKTLNMRIS